MAFDQMKEPFFPKLAYKRAEDTAEIYYTHFIDLKGEGNHGGLYRFYFLFERYPSLIIGPES
jgi:hypothetical protein